MKASPFSKAATASMVVVVPLTFLHAAPETIGLANSYSFIFTESLLRNSEKVSTVND